MHGRARGGGAAAAAATRERQEGRPRRAASGRTGGEPMGGRAGGRAARGDRADCRPVARPRDLRAEWGPAGISGCVAAAAAAVCRCVCVFVG